MIQTLSTVMQLLTGNWWGDYFIIYEVCFTCFKVEYKRSYIFQSSSNEKIIEIWPGLKFGSLRPINGWFRGLKARRLLLILWTNFFLALAFNTPFSYRQKKKHELGEEHDTRLLPNSYYSYGNVFYFISKDA